MSKKRIPTAQKLANALEDLSIGETDWMSVVEDLG